MPYELVPDDAGGGAGYVGRYTTEPQVRTADGVLNFEAACDSDSNGRPDPGAAQQGIVSAEDRVDLRTGGGPKTFYDTPAGDVARGTFERWARTLARFELYGRRVPVTSDEGKALVAWRDDALKEMDKYAAGALVLPGVVKPDPPASYPAGLALLTPSTAGVGCGRLRRCGC